MEVLKIGSRGEAVKELQRLLKIKVDGIFGLETKTAVCIYQGHCGLEVDGVVGEKTWETLKGASVVTNAAASKAVAEWVIYDPLKVHLYKRKDAKGRPIDIKYIVIHYTESGNSKAGRAKATKHTFETREASADFCVDDREVVQFNPDIYNYATWQCGGKKYSGTRGAGAYGKCTNLNSIGIEMCSYNDGGTFRAANHEKWGVTDAVLDNTTRLVKLLMKKYNVPIERVIRHWDVSGKPCPGIVGWNDDELRDAKNGEKLGKYNNSAKWMAFKKGLV